MFILAKDIYKQLIHPNILAYLLQTVYTHNCPFKDFRDAESVWKPENHVRYL